MYVLVLLKHQETWFKEFQTYLLEVFNLLPNTVTVTRMCLAHCEMCGELLERPYPLPCRRHYVGPCCMENIQAKLDQDETQSCEVDGCDTEVPAGYEWAVDTIALENR